jgi:hypothetical protein
MIVNTKKYLITRILGNDIPIVHSGTQTYENLLFTIKNESNFVNTDKIYLLNRIVDKRKRENIINLLNSYSISYLEIPFEYDEYNKIPKLDENTNRIFEISMYKTVNQVNYPYYKILSKQLLEYRLYLMNINAARNYCIEYGKKNGYEWTFVLDSNSFFTDEYYNNIINNIKEDTEYISIPQIRLNDNHLINDNILLSKEKLESLPEEEHQLAFKITSKYLFNEDLPYGSMNKAELLNALGIPGKWEKWGYDIRILDIPPRKFNNIKYQTLSKCIRLYSGTTNNTTTSNWYNRLLGVYILIDNIENDKILESFSDESLIESNDKINIYYIITLLIGVLIVLYIRKLTFNKFF